MQSILRNLDCILIVREAVEGQGLLSASRYIRTSQQFAVSQSDPVLLILEMKEMKLQEVLMAQWAVSCLA